MILFLLILLYIIFNLYSKIDKLESLLTEQNRAEEYANLVYDNLLKLLIKCKVEIDSIDKRGTYSSDDEVGFAFKIIKGSIENLVYEIKKLNDVEETKG